MIERHQKMAESCGVRCVRGRSTRSGPCRLSQGTRRCSAHVEEVGLHERTRAPSCTGRRGIQLGVHTPARSVDRLVVLGDGPEIITWTQQSNQSTEPDPRRSPHPHVARSRVPNRSSCAIPTEPRSRPTRLHPR
jgi:hypothetical protein